MSVNNLLRFITGELTALAEAHSSFSDGRFGAWKGRGGGRTGKNRVCRDRATEGSREEEKGRMEGREIREEGRVVEKRPCQEFQGVSPVFENTHFAFFQILKKHDFLRFLNDVSKSRKKS